jgi:hypothetical protein
VVNLEQLCSRARHRGNGADQSRNLRGCGFGRARRIRLRRYGVGAPPTTRRYFRHEARFGPAIWDVHEVAKERGGAA